MVNPPPLPLTLLLQLLFQLFAFSTKCISDQNQALCDFDASQKDDNSDTIETPIPANKHTLITKQSIRVSRRSLFSLTPLSLNLV